MTFISLLQELEALPADAARVLLSTGKLLGEGFDHAPLDTLVLASSTAPRLAAEALPLSWPARRLTATAPRPPDPASALPRRHAGAAPGQ